MSSTVKAMVYSVTTYSGYMDYAHGCGTVLVEVFIPNREDKVLGEGVCFNKERGAFLAEGPRNALSGKNMGSAISSSTDLLN